MIICLGLLIKHLNAFLLLVLVYNFQVDFAHLLAIRFIEDQWQDRQFEPVNAGKPVKRTNYFLHQTVETHLRLETGRQFRTGPEGIMI